jgi:hypothetical protein
VRSVILICIFNSFAGLLAQNSGQSEIENILQQLKEGKNVSQGLKVQS